jgi:hypothetical protein
MTIKSADITWQGTSVWCHYVLISVVKYREWYKYYGSRILGSSLAPTYGSEKTWRILKRINPGYKISPGDNNIACRSAWKQIRYKTPNPIFCSDVIVRVAAENVAHLVMYSNLTHAQRDSYARCHKQLCLFTLIIRCRVTLC